MKKLNGKYHKNWTLHRKNFLLLCQLYDIPTSSKARMFRKATASSEITWFDAHSAVSAAIVQK